MRFPEYKLPTNSLLAGALEFSEDPLYLLNYNVNRCTSDVEFYVCLIILARWF